LKIGSFGILSFNTLTLFNLLELYNTPVFSLNEETDSIQKLKEEIKKLQEENRALRRFIGKDV